MHPVGQVAAVEPRDLAVARDEHGGVAVDLGVDLLVGELVDLVRAGRRLDERRAVELAGRALERELLGEQLLQASDVVLGDGTGEIVGEARSARARQRSSSSGFDPIRGPGRVERVADDRLLGRLHLVEPPDRAACAARP